MQLPILDIKNKEGHKVNQFENLCKLASKESWCWNVNCTTCGHQHFKYAFLELTQGKSPADNDWITSMGNGSIKKTLGEIPRRFTYQQKETLAIICRAANLSTISRNCESTDWLGYLGLVLHHTRKSSNSRNSEIAKHEGINVFKRLSDDWARQLKALVWRESGAYSRLCEITDEESRIMTLNDLEACEYALMPEVPDELLIEYQEYLDERLKRKNALLNDNNSDRIRLLLKTERAELEGIRLQFLRIFQDSLDG